MKKDCDIISPACDFGQSTPEQRNQIQFYEDQLEDFTFKGDINNYNDCYIALSKVLNLTESIAAEIQADYACSQSEW